MQEQAIIIKTTTDQKEVADKISKVLLEAKKVACVQISEVESQFHWKGKIESCREYIITVKTRLSLSNAVFTLIKKYHNYDVAEILQFNINEIDPMYLDWLIQETEPQIPN